ncbi:MAG: hypothetical protein AAFX02_08060 [Pseudomonadota bacterium]
MQSPKADLITMGIIFLSAIGLGLLVSSIAGVTMSAHGWFALVLGTLVTLGLTGGLFALSFHSARSGHDETVENGTDF